MFDLHTVHLKCFCSFMCPLNVFQTYIKNFNRKYYLFSDFEIKKKMLIMNHYENVVMFYLHVPIIDMSL